VLHGFFVEVRDHVFFSSGKNGFGCLFAGLFRFPFPHSYYRLFYQNTRIYQGGTPLFYGKNKKKT
ncbi:MAG: hypothetical protein ACI4UF_10025, partial [Thermoguttaceae bacterium]